MLLFFPTAGEEVASLAVFTVPAVQSLTKVPVFAHLKQALGHAVSSSPCHISFMSSAWIDLFTAVAKLTSSGEI